MWFHAQLAQKILNKIEPISFSVFQGDVCDKTLNGITDMGFTHMTDIQAPLIPTLVEGRALVDIFQNSKYLFNYHFWKEYMLK